MAVRVNTGEKDVKKFLGMVSRNRVVDNDQAVRSVAGPIVEKGITVGNVGYNSNEFPVSATKRRILEKDFHFDASIILDDGGRAQESRRILRRFSFRRKALLGASLALEAAVIGDVAHRQRVVYTGMYIDE